MSITSIQSSGEVLAVVSYTRSFYIKLQMQEMGETSLSPTRVIDHIY